MDWWFQQKFYYRSNININLNAFRITLIYVIVAGAWILLSDRWAEYLSMGGLDLRLIQHAKGLFFVLVTGGLLYGLIRKYGRQLQVRNTELKDAQRVAQVGSWNYDLSQDILECSDQLYEILNLPNDHTIPSYQDFVELLDSEDQQRFGKLYEQTVKNGGSFEMDTALQSESGKRKYVKILGRGIVDRHQQVQRVFGTIMDITKQKEQELRLQGNLKEKEILIKEIHHRVKNNLAVICSLLELQSDNIQDKQAKLAFEKSQKRVQSMATVHKLLYQDDHLSYIEADLYISRLVELLLSEYMQSVRIVVHKYVEPIRLSLNQAIPTGLILNEMISSSLEKAFSKSAPPPESPKQIKITFKEEHGQLHLSVTMESNVQPEIREKQQSLEISLMRALADQLKGELHYDHQDRKETRIALTFPMADIQGKVVT
jgi:two-component sensor histidine kinase/PAS domain-containing protein